MACTTRTKAPTSTHLISLCGLDAIAATWTNGATRHMRQLRRSLHSSIGDTASSVAHRRGAARLHVEIWRVRSSATAARMEQREAVRSKHADPQSVRRAVAAGVTNPRPLDAADGRRRRNPERGLRSGRFDLRPRVSMMACQSARFIPGSRPKEFDPSASVFGQCESRPKMTMASTPSIRSLTAILISSGVIDFANAIIGSIGLARIGGLGARYKSFRYGRNRTKAARTGRLTNAICSREWQ